MPFENPAIANPAFGKVRIAHVSGMTNLFMVDYPQQHFITLSIKLCELRREIAHDWTFATDEIIEIALSEVQYARLISAPNTEGVECTLVRYRDPKSGKWIENPKVPDKHASDAATFAAEVHAEARKAGEGVNEVLRELNALLDAGPVKKADLSKVRDKLYMADMALRENLGFVVKRADEAISTAVSNAKAEVDAHIDYSLTKLGERALGDRLAVALEAGTNPADVGRLIADAVTDKKPTG